MNAYLIRSSPCSGTDAKARCLGGFLPAVSCNECKTEWFADRVWYPTTRLADESKKKLYSDERTVSLEELIRLREGIVPGSKARTMPPGAGIGPIEAQLSPYATDFVWSAFLLLAAKPAIEKLEDRGVRVPHGSATVFLGRARSEAYVALELVPRHLCSARTEKALGVARCRACGAVWRPGGCDYEVSRNLVYEFAAAKVPNGHGLVLEDVEDFILASDDFRRVYCDNKMTGLTFEKIGVWI